ncbi:hypothetical protein MICH65_0699 [Candidatus Chazhemtobacterium aquaticus]|uniref:Uncharacterized protein n=1 Tax=Candidatus Chazhemtobacterium aquaticus TaxID=2715735 RepID=A0A857NBE5_9BACT|nr:hypothetical protein MICH65_0699 [Candidatus Chazhemtobacterium aquaticus]
MIKTTANTPYHPHTNDLKATTTLDNHTLAINNTTRTVLASKSMAYMPTTASNAFRRLSRHMQAISLPREYIDI